MTDIDAIRRKHEAQVAYTKEKQGDFPYLFQSIHSNLSISDVDALFAALDAERGKVEKAYNALHDFSGSERDMIVSAREILKGGGDE